MFMTYMVNEIQMSFLSFFHSASQAKMATLLVNSTLSYDLNMSESKLSESIFDQNLTEHEHHHWFAIVTLYSISLVSGIIGLGLVLHFYRSNMRSATTMAVLNIILAHTLFLLTVPLRIYFHTTGYWKLGVWMCKITSSMIHIHMYMCLLFYTVILSIRLIQYIRQMEPILLIWPMHGFIASGVLWFLALVVGPCILHFSYGKLEGNKDDGVAFEMAAKLDDQCFDFGYRLKEMGPSVFNYVVSSIFLLVVFVWLGIQCLILALLTMKHRQDFSKNPDYRNQRKSMHFVLIMLVSFVPYHLFRLYYLGHLDMESDNELYLSMTAFSCFDMLIFSLKINHMKHFRCRQG